MKSVAVRNLYKTLMLNDVVRQLHRKYRDITCKFSQDKQSRKITYAVFASNVAFISVHSFLEIAFFWGFGQDIISRFHLDSWRFRLDRDQGFPELFNYVQATACVVLLWGVFRATRQPLYAAWSLTFLVVVVDDSFMIHESVARYSVSTFGIPALPYLRPQDLGEVLVWGAVGSVFLGILWWGFVRSGRNARDAGGVLALAFAALIFCAIGIDMIHMAVSQPRTGLSALLAVLEDGGEMLSLASACAVALLLYRHPAIAR